MAGHSQFKNIMFRKGRQDKERFKLFSKLAREITVAELRVADPELRSLRNVNTPEEYAAALKDAGLPGP